ncbi:excalibur calcium-binding domain-containing protein [Alsobacter sp. R-9]
MTPRQNRPPDPGPSPLRPGADERADALKARFATVTDGYLAARPKPKGRRWGQIALAITAFVIGSAVTLTILAANERGWSMFDMTRHILVFDCSTARLLGVDRAFRGQPGYKPFLDDDGDGIACEGTAGR